jgi:hypothetical protein
MALFSFIEAQRPLHDGVIMSGSLKSTNPVFLVGTKPDATVL